MARLLIVDDEEKIRGIVRKYAENEGHIVTEAQDGMTAIRLVETDAFDAVILDLVMPGLDGYSVLRQIRKNREIPVLILSARGEEYDRIRGFELGADDYIVKPFSPRELILRVNAVLKRSLKCGCCQCSGDQEESTPESGDQYQNRGITVDFLKRTLIVDGEEKELTYKSFELLTYLIRNRNLALSRCQILSAVWGFDYYGDERTLDTHIKYLRNAFGPYRDLIVTVRNVGYRLDEKN